jgi:LPXTG-motif cell wall-anchored protein
MALMPERADAMMDPVSLLTALGPLAGALGGGKSGDVNVSQSSNNVTSVNLSSALNNQSPGDVGGVSGGSSGSASTSAGTEPLQASPFATPYEGFGSVSATESFAQATGQQSISKTVLIAAGVIVVGGAFLLFGKKKR